MRLLRDNQIRVLPVAIMLTATLAIVWHGAMSLLAHPLIASSYAETMHVAIDEALPREHSTDTTDHHATHEHGKSKSGAHCCSTVSAVTLPAPAASDLVLPVVRLVRPLAAIVGVGIEPSTPAEPPSITYQC